MEEDEVVRLAGEADRIWNSPLVQDFMKNFVMEVFVEWSNERDPVQREMLWMQVQAADKTHARTRTEEHLYYE